MNKTHTSIRIILLIRKQITFSCKNIGKTTLFRTKIRPQIHAKLYLIVFKKSILRRTPMMAMISPYLKGNIRKDKGAVVQSIMEWFTQKRA